MCRIFMRKCHSGLGWHLATSWTDA
jgi:hypothetical protein